jgi:hypothetical protein
MTTGRRALRFSSLRDVPRDVEQLLSGHRTVGRWSLAQICNHLSGAINHTIDGFPGRAAPWFIRQSAGKIILWLMLGTGRIAEGVKIPTEYLPRDDLDARREAENLVKAIERFLAAQTPFKSHPLVGQLSHARWQRYHCVHCAHHLSFAVSCGHHPAC